jgi:hypothetical protein
MPSSMVLSLPRLLLILFRGVESLLRWVNWIAHLTDVIREMQPQFPRHCERKRHHSKSDSSAALPPAAEVLMLTVCSVAKRVK